MAQFARPDSIVSAGSWTGAATAIDESTPSDADFIFSPNNPNNTVEIGLSNVSDPQASTGHVLRVRLTQGDADGSTPDGGGTATNYTITLVQGTTTIATAASAVTSPSTWTTVTYNLSGAEANAISDYTDLRVRVLAAGGGGSPSARRDVAVSWVELEVPDAPSGQQYNQSVSGSLGFTGNIAKRTGRALSAALGFSGSIARQTSRSLLASVGFGGQVTKSTSRSISASLGLDGTVLKLTSRSASGSLDFSTSFSAQLVAPETPALIAIHFHPE